MAPKSIKTTIVSKEDYRDYLFKAQTFFSALKLCLQNDFWDAAILLGVHASISVTDALLVFYVQRRSISKNHNDVVRLLMQSLQNKKDIKKNANRLTQIIDTKHSVEYEPKRFTQKTAYDLAKKVDRYFEWALSQLPS